ncbi:sugar transferase [bacterium]|nr:sugar transferase [bacterium]
MKITQKLYLLLKRFIGIVGSLVGIIVAFAFLWWWIIPINTIVTKGHPFFIQKRLGKNKKVFGLIKFRSMRMDANPNLAPSSICESTQKSMETNFGAFLRRTSFDETPQFFNILIGQMAFIGPRPGAATNEEELILEREKYTPNAFLVKPGLSGLAQIKIRREHNPSLKAKYDHEYVVKLSLWLDIYIFFVTVFRIFARSDGAR